MDSNNHSDSRQRNLQAPKTPEFDGFFVGTEGLRSGWRFIIYVASFLMLSRIVFPYISYPVLVKLPRLWFFLVTECESLIAAVLPALALSYLERRPFDDYGLPHKSAFGKNFWIGAIWGFAAITLLLLTMRGLGNFYFGGIALHGMRLLKFAAFWGVLFLLVGLSEEFLARGYSQFTLTQGVGFWPAAVIISILFALMHWNNQGEAWIGLLGIVCISLFWCLTLQRTGNLWFAVGMHSAWDWGETYFYSVPDSGITAPGHLMNPTFQGSKWITGGSVGPEGSLLVFVLIGILWIGFDRMYPAKRAVAMPIDNFAQPGPPV